MTEITYFTAKPFIDSRYKNKRLGDYEKSKTTESLAEFNKKNISLINANMELRITTRPENAGIHKFTITYCDETGRKLSAESILRVCLRILNLWQNKSRTHRIGHVDVLANILAES